MKKNEQWLKLIFSSETMRDRPVSRANCPPPEDLLNSFYPETPLEEKIKIVDHLSHCPACQREFELLKNFYHLIKEIDSRIIKKRSGLLNRLQHSLTAFFPFWKPAVISLILLIFFIGLFFEVIYQKNLVVSRGPDYSEQYLLTENIDLGRQPSLVLNWQPVAGASLYKVEIYDETMFFLWQSDILSNTSVVLPEDLVNTLKNKQFFFWQLLALDNNKKLIESYVKKVRLAGQ